LVETERQVRDVAPPTTNCHAHRGTNRQLHASKHGTNRRIIPRLNPHVKCSYRTDSPTRTGEGCTKKCPGGVCLPLNFDLSERFFTIKKQLKFFSQHTANII